MNIHPTTAGAASDLEAMAESLAASGRYRVLRRLMPRRCSLPDEEAATRRGLFVDVETTGLDPTHDEIIELAMIPFFYTIDGRILRTVEPFERFRQPSVLIPPQVTALTGIDDAMVADKTIEAPAVEALVDEADLVVAHNAGFDRRFLERLFPVFANRPWACSMSQIAWSDEGFEGTKLAYLAMGAGFFYDRHRAANDCAAAIELLAAVLPKSGRTGLSQLLQVARRRTWRIWAENSPYALKDQLKRRGYRWNGDGAGRPRAWFIDVEDGNLEQELEYLRQQVFGRNDVELPVREVTAYDRFSDRV
jgi:DNA polymerase III subunit epsilon